MRRRNLVLACILIVMATLLLAGGPLTAAGASGWKRMAANGFGDAGNTEVSSLAVYRNVLYAGTTNRSTGCQVWRKDPKKWANVTGGKRLGEGNTCAACMTIFRGKLYVGTNKGFDWKSTPGEIWEYDGKDWRRMWAGAGSEERGIHCFAVFRGSLYVGTVDRDVSGSDCYGLANVYRWNGSPDDFTRVTCNGIDPAGLGPDGKYDPKICNIVSDELAVYNNALYVGTNKG